MDQLDELLASLHLNEIIVRDDIPNIDLYMDQVTQIFEATYASGKRHDKDKLLTKTMINNYAKDQLLFPIKNKKYTKEHIKFIQFIYQLKGSLSISDTQIVLAQLNQAVRNDQVDLGVIYDQYVSLMTKQVDDFTTALSKMNDDVRQAIEPIDDQDPDYSHTLFLIFSLVHQSNMYRKMAERLTDELSDVAEAKHEKS